MPAIAEAASELVRAATMEGSDRALRAAVEAVLAAFNPKDKAGTRSALKTIGSALERSDGRSAQVLALALGALVETGAPPDEAWPAVAEGLIETLERATVFAQACVRAAKTEHVEPAIEAAAADVAAALPREAASWRALPSRCLAAVACLSRSRALRKKLSSTDELLAAVWPLSDVVAEAGFIVQLLSIEDKGKLLVIHPASMRGWKLTMTDVASNADLYVLVMDAIARDPKKGPPGARKPDAKLVALAKNEAAPPKRPPVSRPAFEWLQYSALSSDGTIAPDDVDSHAHAILPDAVPAAIPAFDGERVILLVEASHVHEIEHTPPFEGLAPRVDVVGVLSEKAVKDRLLVMGKAAERGRSPKSKKPKAAKKAKKTPPKAPKASKKKTRAARGRRR